MPTSAHEVPISLKRAFLRGAIRMAHEDADDVKVILVAGGFVEPNRDGSIPLTKNGWFKSCLLPKHTVAALGLLVRLQRWEQSNFDGHRTAGIPSANVVLAHIRKHMLSRRPQRQLTRWQALRWQVYRDHVAWLSEPELIVHSDPAADPDAFTSAIADFLISATISSRKKRR